MNLYPFQTSFMTNRKCFECILKPQLKHHEVEGSYVIDLNPKSTESIICIFTFTHCQFNPFSMFIIAIRTVNVSKSLINQPCGLLNYQTLDPFIEFLIKLYQLFYIFANRPASECRLSQGLISQQAMEQVNSLPNFGVNGSKSN